MKKLSKGTLEVKRAKRQRKPKHKTVTRAYAFPMVVEGKQHANLQQTLSACWRLRNNLVADRCANRQTNKDLRQQGADVKTLHYLNQSDQYAFIPEYARRDTALSKVHSQVRQNVAVRVNEGYNRFLDAIKKGRSGVNPPKFMELKKYRSITYPQYGPGAHIRTVNYIYRTSVSSSCMTIAGSRERPRL